MPKIEKEESLVISLIGDIVVPSKDIDVQYQFPHCVLGNLEAPINPGNEKNRRLKAGPTLCSYQPPQLPVGSVVSLANNHMMDYGFEGVIKTQERLKENGISYIGAGRNLKAANEGHVLVVNGIKIGILARCDKQFGVAGLETPGVAPLTPAVYQDIAKLKNDTDIVIISVHGGAEMCPWPSPQWQDLFRSFIDAGASIVHGHHAHVPQGFEEYKGGYIFYGMGNFLVNPDDWKNRPNTLWSLTAQVCFKEKRIDTVQVEAVLIDDHDGKTILRKSNSSEDQEHQKYIGSVNEILKDRKLLTGLWQESSIRMYHLWYAQWLGIQGGNFIDRAKRIFRRLKKNGKKKNMLLQYHLFSCEAHQDAIMTALGVLGGELEDLRSDETRKLADRMIPWSIKGRRV